MKIWKQIIVALLCFGLFGCSAPADADSHEALYQAGTYKAESQGRNGPIAVETEVSENEITSVKILSHTETAGVADPALERIPQAIVDGQTLAVDVVSGATITSEAILAAVTDCITQAGGDITALQQAAAGNDNEEGSHQALSADVVVVGGGLAGISAAIAAVDEGADVILLERQAALGGNSILSSGIFHFGATDIQKAAGVTDTVEDFDQALLDAAVVQGGERDPVQTRLMAEHSNETLNWMIDNGVVFKDEVTYLMGSAKVPRGHRVTPDTASAIFALGDSADAKGVHIMMETTATKLLTDANGAVIGVEAVANTGDSYTITASKTILANGGYRASNELTVKYLGEDFDGLLYCGAPGVKGEMTDAAITLGADTFQLDRPYLSPTYTTAGITITSSVLSKGGILVNAEGKRFCNEPESYRMTALNVLEQETGGRKVYEIFDETLHGMEPLTEKYISGGVAIPYDTLEELAAGVGLDYETLKATVDTYNKAVVGEGEDPFGRTVTNEIGLVEGPFYAIDIQPGGNLSGGGLKVDEQCRVIKTDGSLFENLYATGEVVGGIRAFGYAGGDSLAHCAITGRVAGASAAASK